MHANDTVRHRFLAAELEWIRHAVAYEVPLLGICLGAQLIAKALGGEVYPLGRKERGWHTLQLLPAAWEDPLFAPSPLPSTAQNEVEVFQWHQDTFTLPDQAVHLARSALAAHQAFRFGATTYGVQFHPEVTPSIIECWAGKRNQQRESSRLTETSFRGDQGTSGSCFPEAGFRTGIPDGPAAAAKAAGDGGIDEGALDPLAWEHLRQETEARLTGYYAWSRQLLGNFLKLCRTRSLAP